MSEITIKEMLKWLQKQDDNTCAVWQHQVRTRNFITTEKDAEEYTADSLNMLRSIASQLRKAAQLPEGYRIAVSDLIREVEICIAQIHNIYERGAFDLSNRDLTISKDVVKKYKAMLAAAPEKETP